MPLKRAAPSPCRRLRLPWTTAEALDAVKARLQAVNADVQVEQEEYDEIVAIKALFLNHDYQ